MKYIKISFFRKIWLRLPFVCFVIAVLCLCFAYGVAVGEWHVFPEKFLNKGWDSLREILNKPPLPHFIKPARYEGEGVVVYDPEQAYPGVTLLTGYHKNEGDWDLGIRLVDLNGKILHEWKCNPRDIWARSPHNDYATGSKDDKTQTTIHGALLLPNGDVVFNLEHFSLVRMNSNSEVIWKLPYRTHHSVVEDSEGNFWVCGAKWIENNIPDYVSIRPPFYEDMIVRVSPNGVIEREISLLKVIYKSGYDGLLRFHTGDILHLNDVEVLEKEKAGAFKGIFDAGDILVSLRNINTVFVIDGRTEQIKWSLTHPFFGQHDPDFTEQGYITVIDNHCEINESDLKADGYKKQGSRIVSINPFTKKVTTLYGWKNNQYFFTQFAGKHQHLPNGNMIITETEAGRVFEINPNGKVVWDWIVERWDKDYVPAIQQGTRYSMDFANFTNKFRKDER